MKRTKRKRSWRLKLKYAGLSELLDLIGHLYLSGGWLGSRSKNGHQEDIMCF